MTYKDRPAAFKRDVLAVVGWTIFFIVSYTIIKLLQRFAGIDLIDFAVSFHVRIFWFVVYDIWIFWYNVFCIAVSIVYSAGLLLPEDYQFIENLEVLVMDWEQAGHPETMGEVTKCLVSTCAIVAVVQPFCCISNYWFFVSKETGITWFASTAVDMSCLAGVSLGYFALDGLLNYCVGMSLGVTLFDLLCVVPFRISATVMAILCSVLTPPLCIIVGWERMTGCSAYLYDMGHPAHASELGNCLVSFLAAAIVFLIAVCLFHDNIEKKYVPTICTTVAMSVLIMLSRFAMRTETQYDVDFCSMVAFFFNMGMIWNSQVIQERGLDGLMHMIMCRSIMWFPIAMLGVSAY